MNLTLDRRRERNDLVDAVRAQCLSPDARGVLCDWERDHGDPEFADWMSGSYDDFRTGDYRDVLLGAYLWRPSFWPSVVGVPCRDMQRIFGKNGDRTTTNPFRTGLTTDTPSHLPQGFLYLSGLTWDVDVTGTYRSTGTAGNVKAYACGGVLSELYCPFDFWCKRGPDIVERTPVTYVETEFFRPVCVRHRRRMRGVRYAWFNEAHHDDRFTVRPDDRSRIPEELFRRLPENDNPRVARYDEFDAAQKALSAALLSCAIGWRDEGLQRVPGPPEAGG